jgi:DNA-binding transcriptional ArsR family regulator
MERLEAQARLFKALMHPARLAILEALREDEHCVCHLEAALGYRQAYISQQLTVLREAGLVQDRRDGWNIYYHATQPQVFALLDQAAELAGVSAQAPGPAQQKPCPCPKCQAAAISLSELAPETTGRERS